jgi:CTP-dependent riboflavin kinase
MKEQSNELNDITITKDQVIEALDGKHFLKKNATEALKALVCCSTGNIVKMTVADLSRLIQVEPKACYRIIKKLQKDGYIIAQRNEEIGLKLSEYIINPNKLLALVKDYRVFKFGKIFLEESIENKRGKN